MKKFLFCLLIAIASFSTLNAQLTQIGGGLTYGTGYHYNNFSGVGADLYRSPFAGIFLTHIFKLKLPVHIVPSFAFFLPRTNNYAIPTGAPEKTRVSSIMFDINGHYVFNSLDRFEFFGLAGFDITFTHIVWVGTVSKDSDNGLGLNLGAGSYIKINNKLNGLVEAKYIISKYHQFMLNAGVLLNIDWLKKHEDAGIN